MDNRGSNLINTGPAVGRHPQVPISQILEPGHGRPARASRPVLRRHQVRSSNTVDVRASV